MSASVRRSSAHAARLSRRSVNSSAAPAADERDGGGCKHYHHQLAAQASGAHCGWRTARATGGCPSRATVYYSFDFTRAHLALYRKYGPLLSDFVLQERIGEHYELTKPAMQRARRMSRVSLLVLATSVSRLSGSCGAILRRRREGRLPFSLCFIHRMARGRAADGPFVIAVCGAEDVATHLDDCCRDDRARPPRAWCAASRAPRSSTASTFSMSAPSSRWRAAASLREARHPAAHPHRHRRRTRARCRRRHQFHRSGRATCASRFR